MNPVRNPRREQVDYQCFYLISNGMKNNKSGFVAVFGIIIVLALLGGSVYLYQQKASVAPAPVACTMEAKLCPDGSSVGRTGPNCEFATCPGASPAPVVDNSFRTLPAPNVVADGCSVINNSIFQSVEKREMGNSPSGQVMGYAMINLKDLKDGNVHWQYSDVEETGNYSCNNSVLEVKLSNRSIEARYDGNRDVLIWDALEYRKAK